MSEDSFFYSKNKPQKKEEREHAPDFCGSLGKGMLAMEYLRNAPGLTPLRFDVEIHNRNSNRGSLGDRFSTTEGAEILSNSSGLSVKSSGLIPIGMCLSMGLEPQMNTDERRCGSIGIGRNNGDAETQRLSDLSAPLSLRGELPRRGVI